jgi:hypothetical protein
MEVVWTVWKTWYLRGIYTSRPDAEAAADRLHAEQPSADRAAGLADGVRVEPWAVADSSANRWTGHRGARPREVADEIHKKWGLIPLNDLGTAHYFQIDRYLAIPYEGRLQFPAFQFTTGRELWPGFQEALRVLRESGWDDTSSALWFISHQHTLDASIPALCIRDDPDAVIRAAHTDSRARPDRDMA